MLMAVFLLSSGALWWFMDGEARGVSPKHPQILSERTQQETPSLEQLPLPTRQHAKQTKGQGTPHLERQPVPTLPHTTQREAPPLEQQPRPSLPDVLEWPQVKLYEIPLPSAGTQPRANFSLDAEALPGRGMPLFSQMWTSGAAPGVPLLMPAPRGVVRMPPAPLTVFSSHRLSHASNTRSTLCIPPSQFTFSIC